MQGFGTVLQIFGFQCTGGTRLGRVGGGLGKCLLAARLEGSLPPRLLVSCHNLVRQKGSRE